MKLVLLSPAIWVSLITLVLAVPQFTELPWGANLTVGGTYTFSWTGGNGQPVTLSLVQGASDTLVGYLAENLTSTSFKWITGSYLPSGNDYALRLTESSATSLSSRFAIIETAANATSSAESTSTSAPSTTEATNPANSHTTTANSGTTASEPSSTAVEHRTHLTRADVAGVVIGVVAIASSLFVLLIFAIALTCLKKKAAAAAAAAGGSRESRIFGQPQTALSTMTLGPDDGDAYPKDIGFRNGNLSSRQDELGSRGPLVPLPLTSRNSQKRPQPQPHRRYDNGDDIYGLEVKEIIEEPPSPVGKDNEASTENPNGLGSSKQNYGWAQREDLGGMVHPGSPYHVDQQQWEGRQRLNSHKTNDSGRTLTGNYMFTPGPPQ